MKFVGVAMLLALVGCQCPITIKTQGGQILQCKDWFAASCGYNLYDCDDAVNTHKCVTNFDLIKEEQCRL